MQTPFIFDIIRSSTVDGPGIRTTVFFKGCNLDCFWCHNPESKSPHPQIARFNEKCIGCGSCKKVCDTDGTCSICGKCTLQCPSQALKIYGKQYEKQDLIDIISADIPYYNATGGGVTFSGGECMLYPNYLADIASTCKAMEISVAIDTAGNVPFDSFEKVLPYTDIFLYDIKAIDSALHKKGTGADNTLILENLQKLQKRGKNILIRIPVIPNFNKGQEATRIEEYCKQNGFKYQLLEYHENGISKQKALSDFRENLHPYCK